MFLFVRLSEWVSEGGWMKDKKKLSNLKYQKKTRRNFETKAKVCLFAFFCCCCCSPQPLVLVIHLVFGCCSIKKFFLYHSNLSNIDEMNWFGKKIFFSFEKLKKNPNYFDHQSKDGGIVFWFKYWLSTIGYEWQQFKIFIIN